VAGLEVDLDLGPLEIMAGVKAELSELNKHNAATAAWRKREWERSRVPSYVNQRQSVVIPAGGARTGMGFTGPRAGYFMLLRRLIIGGLTWKTTAAGTAEVYVTALPSGAIASMGLSDMVDQAVSLPNKAYYSNQQVRVNPGEHVEMIIDTGTAAQQYVATGFFEIWRDLSGETVFES
jgi:hypothetical protein